MKKAATLLFALFLTIAFGQDLPKQKTENHQQIEGTNIFMVPPVSYQLSTNFKGFQNPDDQTTMIMAMEIPGPYLEVTKGFNTEMLKTKGMVLKNKSEIKVGEYTGLLVEINQLVNEMEFTKHILVYGNEKATTIINGVFLKDSLESGKKIKESILTTFVDARLVTKPRESLNYSINENIGNLKFHSVMGNAMIFNRDLKTPTESIDKATLFVDRSFAKIKIENKKEFCISRLKSYPDNFVLNQNKKISEITIDNLKGFELYAKNNAPDEDAYQVILFDDNGGYFLFLGTYLKGNVTAENDIKNCIKSFKSKI